MRQANNYFICGVWLKGIQGSLEILGGVLLWFLNPVMLNDMARLFYEHELTEYPHSSFVHVIHHYAKHWSLSTQHFGGIYLILDGLINVGLVAGLLRKKLWAYPLAAVVISLFVVYQIHRLLRTHSLVLFCLSVTNILIVMIILKEYDNLQTF